MPFQSEKQRRYLHANHPEIAKRWEKEYATGGISNHFRKKYSLGSMVTQARQENDGIESRLEQLGGDVTSAEQLLQQINQRLQTAGSSVPEGGGATAQPGLGIFAGRPVNIGGIAQPLPAGGGPAGGGIGGLIPGQPIGTPGAFGPSTMDLQPALGQPAGLLPTPDPATHTFGAPNTHWDKMATFGVLPYDLMDPRGTKYSSIEAAYNNAQDSAMEMRRVGRRGPDILPGEMSFDDYKNNFTFNDGFITNNTGANKFYEKDLTSDPNRFPVSSYYDTYRNPESDWYQRSHESTMGIAKDRYVPLPGSSQQLSAQQGPRVLGIGSQNLATGGIANHFKFKNGGNATKNIKGQPHMLAYITPKEAKTLENLGGQKTMTKEGIPAYPPSDNYGGNWGGSSNNNDNQGSDHSHSRFEPGSGYYGETKTSTPTGGDNTTYKDPIITLAETKRKEDLKNMTKNWEDEWGKWDDPKQKYSFTKEGVDKRKNITTQEYLDRKTELEAKIRNNLLITLGSAFFLGTPVGLKDLVGIDWKDKKFSGVLADAMSLSQLEKEYLTDLEGYKQNYADLGIPTHSPHTDTAIQTINQEILDITQKPDKEEIKDDGGPTPLVVPKVMEAFADATGEIDMFDAWSNIKQKQALRAGLFADEDQAKVGEWVGDQRLLVNSGGLANLFRVKNQ